MYALKIDAGKKPATINLEISSGGSNGKKQLGIYELEGGMWKLCVSELRSRDASPQSSACQEGLQTTALRIQKEGLSRAESSRRGPCAAHATPGRSFTSVRGGVRVAFLELYRFAWNLSEYRQDYQETLARLCIAARGLPAEHQARRSWLFR